MMYLLYIVEATLRTCKTIDLKTYSFITRFRGNKDLFTLIKINTYYLIKSILIHY